MKRSDYINWDEYFMGIALLTAMRSKDPNSQVGACIVSPENKILSLGYNGMPMGCSDDEMPWEREGEPLHTKYMYVCHPVRHCRGGVLRRQVPRQRFQHRGTVHVPEGGRETDPLHPQRPQSRAGTVTPFPS